MMYRSGYSYKDENQSRILALRMRHADFVYLLENAIVVDDLKELSTEQKGEVKDKPRVQWDPERGPGLEKLEWRSLQVGIGKAWVEWWVERIVGIEDVTDRARELKTVVEGEGYRSGELGEEELIKRGLVPLEREFEMPKEVRRILRMDLSG